MFYKQKHPLCAIQVSDWTIPYYWLQVWLRHREWWQDILRLGIWMCPWTFHFLSVSMYRRLHESHAWCTLYDHVECLFSFDIKLPTPSTCSRTSSIGFMYSVGGNVGSGLLKSFLKVGTHRNPYSSKAICKSGSTMAARMSMCVQYRTGTISQPRAWNGRLLKSSYFTE